MTQLWKTYVGSAQIRFRGFVKFPDLASARRELYGREILEVLKQFREGAAARPSISGQIEPSVARVAPAVNKADSNPKRKREAWWGAR